MDGFRGHHSAHHTCHEATGQSLTGLGAGSFEDKVWGLLEAGDKDSLPGCRGCLSEPGVALGVPLGGTRRVGGLLGVAGRLSGTVSPFRAEQGTSLETPSRASGLKGVQPPLPFGESQRIDAFELWCWRRLPRVPWTARRSNQSILKVWEGGEFKSIVGVGEGRLDGASL